MIPNLFLKFPYFKKLFKLNELLTNLESKLNLNKLVTTEHSDYHIETYANFHTDTGANNNSYLPNNFYKINEFSDIYKVAIFNSSGILTPTEFKINNKIIKLNLTLGDVIIFRIEAIHRGRPINKFFKLFSLFFYLKHFFTLFNLYKYKREAIFFTIGQKSEALNFYREANLLNAKNFSIKFFNKFV